MANRLISGIYWWYFLDFGHFNEGYVTFNNSFVSLKLYHNENLKIKKCFSYIADPFCCTVETNTTI